MRERPGRRPALVRGASAVALASVLALATGCVADPPPPTVLGEEDPAGATIRQTSAGVSLAIDRLDEGLNPHLLSDLGQDTDLYTSLTLPSAFRAGTDGGLEPDPALVISADEVSPSPFTVRYTLRQQAQWSDGVPVGAEDFEYLWRQMRSQPGVVDPDGYEHVTAVRSGAGGKVVEVEFDAPYARWRTLFSALLPAHLLKDAPGGFQKALAKGSATSAGPFMVNKADLGRGVVEFVRNDRYWETPPVLDQIVVRRVTGAQALGQALRTGPGSMASVADTSLYRTVVATVPGLSSSATVSTTQLELAFGTTAPWGSDAGIRHAAAAAVSPSVVGRIVTGAAEQDTVDFPFPSGTGAPATSAAGAVPGLLTKAGADQRGDRWYRGDRAVSLTVGVASGDADAVSAAYTVVDQLHAVGLGARVWEVDAVALYGDALPHGLVDVVVTRQRTDTDPVVAAASRFGCPTAPAVGSDGTIGDPTRTATTRSDLAPPAPDVGTSTSAMSTTPGSAPSPTRVGDPAAPARASGVTGVCDPVLDAALGEAASAPDPVSALERAGRRAAELALRVPLVRPRHLLARSVDIAGLPATTTATTTRFDTAMFDAAPRWRRN